MKINSLKWEQFRFKSVWTKKCDESLYSKSFIFDYSWVAKASTKWLYSKEYDSNLSWYISNWWYWFWYTISHWWVRDVWLRDNSNNWTRWQTVSWNPCWYTSWYYQSWNSARPNIKMYVK